ncbi:hypothetical protein [Actinomycetospora atypica]|uniref:Transcriptional regulator n=1 Tax=Actinomycetospora atypica TaxID=1290095 RepID=A0ABV9YDR3_9PSEU
MDHDVGEQRRRSLAVFGNRYVVDVVLAVEALLAGDGVTVRMIAKSVDLADNLVRPVVLRLVAAGFLVQQAPARPRGPTFYVRGPALDEPWSALCQLCSLLARGGQA